MKRIYKTKEELIEQVKFIAEHYGKDKSCREIADKLNIKSSALSARVSSLRSLGVDIPRIKRAGFMVYAVRELARTNPELIKKEYLKNYK